MSLGEKKAILVTTTTLPEVGSLDPGTLVVCQESWDTDDYREAARKRGARVVVGNHRYEVGEVGTLDGEPYFRCGYTTALPSQVRDGLISPPWVHEPGQVAAARTAYEVAVEALVTPLPTAPAYEPAERYMPAQFVAFLPHPTLNPAQVQAVGHILGDRPVLVTAPTGAGKTVLGMVACLREIFQRGGKAVWLVPQRSLTAELDRELERWRALGVSVVSLSGEITTDVQATQSASLWVATTEKFEALCRATSLADAVEQVGTIVVDEIHLLGDPSRGPVLEALLARIRGLGGPADGSRVRVVGLSATAGNAQEVADWIGADLVEVTWRPTRLTTQILALPVADRPQETRHRQTVVKRIVADLTTFGGSVLVFCGTKANVRAMALAVAASRGADVSGVQPTDTQTIERVCASVKVGLHYSDWPGKRAAETGFRARTLDVLVATSTLAAGVNTPALAVIVADTRIGGQPMDISTIQQMFGRAGRAGQEPEGFAYLLASAHEVPDLRRRLVDGYTIVSGLLDGSLADHLLGEVVQGHVKTLGQAQAWWEATFAHYQAGGATGEHAVRDARDYLVRWGFLKTEERAGDQGFTVTPTGAVTSRMMVPVTVAAGLLRACRVMANPTTAGFAEETLINVVASEGFSSGYEAPADFTAAISRIIDRGGDANRPTVRGRQVTGRPSRVPSPVVARAGMLAGIRSPAAFAVRDAGVLGVPRSVFQPVLDEAPRYCAWLAAVGAFGAVPAWVAVVARDVGPRLTWLRTLPVRGDGRLLWAIEKHVGADQPTVNVPRLFRDAQVRGVTSVERWVSARSAQGGGATGLPTVITVTAHTRDVAAAPGVSTVFTHEDGKWVRRRRPEPGKPIVAFAEGGDCVGNQWMAQFSSRGNRTGAKP